RPGPNQVWAVVEPPPGDGAIVRLVLQSGGSGTGAATRSLAPATPPVGLAEGAAFAAGGVVLSPDTSWNAALVVTERNGGVATRRQFSFALGPAGLTD